MTILSAFAAYREQLAASSLPACWRWNMEASFRWGTPRDYVVSCASARAETTSDRWPELGCLVVLLAQEGDTVLFDGAGDCGFDVDLLDHWKGLGARLPRVRIAAQLDGGSLHQQAVIELVGGESESLVAAAGAACPDPNSLLVCFGTTADDETFAAERHLLLFGGSAASTETCNDKRTAKLWCRELGLPTPEGRVCSSATIAEETAADLFERHATIVVKDPYGASGKGLVLCNSIDRVRRVLRRFPAQESQCSATSVIVEAWLEKRVSHNAQYLILPDGNILYLGHTEQVLAKQKYLGNNIPRGWPQTFHEDQFHTYEQIAQRAYREGYHGIIGIDSFITYGGVWFPCVELNARFNLSTYALAFLERIGYPNVACFKNYLMKWHKTLSLQEFFDVLDVPWLRRGMESGVVPLIFTGRTSPASRGLLRLGMLFLADAPLEVNALRSAFEVRLSQLCAHHPWE
jgi:hypothetical protein